MNENKTSKQFLKAIFANSYKRIGFCMLLLISIFLLGYISYKIGFFRGEEKQLANNYSKENSDSVSQSDIYSTWSKYENKEYGFSFFYPEHWVIAEQKGEPYYENTELKPEQEYGFTIILTEDKWNYRLTFNPYYFDQHSLNNINKQIENITIANKEWVRVIYNKYDLKTREEMDSIFIVNITEPYMVNEQGKIHYWESPLQLTNDKLFVIEYIPKENTTIENSLDSIEIMDLISQSIKVN